MVIELVLNFITLGILALFSLLYLSTAIKAPAVQKVIGLIKAHLDNLALLGVVYGIVAGAIVAVKVVIPKYMFVFLLGNVVLVVIALPYMLHKFEKKLEQQNAAIVSEMRESLSFITNNEKIFGFIGAAACGGIVAATLGLY